MSMINIHSMVKLCSDTINHVFCGAGKYNPNLTSCNVTIEDGHIGMFNAAMIYCATLNDKPCRLLWGVNIYEPMC